jgi:hypothetical protein
MDPQGATDLPGPLLAAATMAAKHAEYAVRVVLPNVVDPLGHAEQAAELAGVDAFVVQKPAQSIVQFVARHQDRRVTRQQLRATGRSTPGRAAPPAPHSLLPRPVDVAAFRRASEALALNRAEDPEAEAIWGCLLRARPAAHTCGGVPTLVVNDVGGVVGMLRRRARVLGVAMRINPDACACA